MFFGSIGNLMLFKITQIVSLWVKFGPWDYTTLAIVFLCIIIVLATRNGVLRHVQLENVWALIIVGGNVDAIVSSGYLEIFNKITTIIEF